MPRENKVFNTYSRRKQRVVTTDNAELWSKTKAENTRNVFSSSSSFGSLNESKLFENHRITRNQRNKLADISNTTSLCNSASSEISGSLGDSGTGIFKSFDEEHDVKTQRGRRVAANATKPIVQQKSSKISKPNTTVSNTHKRSPPSVLINNSVAVGELSELSATDEAKPASFSEFEKYSLIISESDPCLNSVPPTPEIEMRSIDKSQTNDALTSTPHVIKISPKVMLYNSLIRESDISHIDVVEESPQPISLRHRRFISKLGLERSRHTSTNDDLCQEKDILYEESLDTTENEVCGIEGEVRSHHQDGSAESISPVSSPHVLGAYSEMSPPSHFQTYNVSAVSPQTRGLRDYELPIISPPINNRSIESRGEHKNTGKPACRNSLKVCVEGLEKLNLSCTRDIDRPCEDETQVVCAIRVPELQLIPEVNKSASHDGSKSLFDSSQGSYDSKVSNSKECANISNSVQKADGWNRSETRTHSVNAIADINHYLEEEDSRCNESETVDVRVHELSDQNTIDYSSTGSGGDSSAPSGQGNTGNDTSSSLYQLVDESAINNSSQTEETDSLTSEQHTESSSYCISEHSVFTDHEADTSIDDSITRRRKAENKYLSKLREDLESSCHTVQEMLTPVKLRRTGRVVSAVEKIMLLCNQVETCSFEDALPAAMLRKCVKIGEGVYGEVFSTQRNREGVAIKIVPIEGDFPVNDEPQKTYDEMVPELVISKELSDLSKNEINSTSNFVTIKRISLVQGSYPNKLLQEWDAYDSRKNSENDRPDIFEHEQKFILFEFENAGCDLEGVKLVDLMQARSIIYQVTCSLAIAEVALHFEHRDLHWGNVLVKPTDQESVWFQLDGEEFGIDTHGVKVSIIDFTLSRLTKDGCSVYTDLSQDPTLFEGQGDYQFDVYRLMKEENENDWKPHHSFTNVLWIHYLAEKLLHSKAYTDTTSKEHKSLARHFRTFIREVLDYRSALHLMKNCPFFSE